MTAFTAEELIKVARMVQEITTCEPLPDGTFVKLPRPGAVMASYGRVNLGNGTLYHMAFVTLGRGTLVAIEGRGAFVFSRFVSASYAAEKLGLGAHDAGNVADLINQRLGLDTPGPRQGTYKARYCFGSEEG